MGLDNSPCHFIISLNIYKAVYEPFWLNISFYSNYEAYSS